MRLMEWIQLTGKTLHGHIYLWRWRSHQSLARKGLRIFRFCVMSWKDEPEPTIQCCLGRQVDVVQKFVIIQSFGHNWRWADEIRVEYFPRIHHTAALQRSPWVHVQNERSVFKGRIIFMSMFNDILWRSEDNERECIANDTLVSIFAKRFPAGRWAFLGPRSEK